jgi:hypothetical protein
MSVQISRSTIAMAVVGATTLGAIAVRVSAQETTTARPKTAVPAERPDSNKTARERAPIDLTGYWVSVVTQDWRWRMLTPAKGDYTSVPLNAEGQKLAGAWDPARDEARGERCKAYGAAAIMRVPGRLHMTWQDEGRLRIDTEAGAQTRLIRFGGLLQAASRIQWQGQSLGEWQIVRGGKRFQPTETGSLKVVTTHMRPGYLRKNGVPYSDKAVLTEYFDVTDEPDGSRFLLLTSIVEDPAYLTESYLLTTPFRKLPGDQEWHPTPCSSR